MIARRKHVGRNGVGFNHAVGAAGEIDCVHGRGRERVFTLQSNPDVGLEFRPRRESLTIHHDAIDSRADFFFAVLQRHDDDADLVAEGTGLLCVGGEGTSKTLAAERSFRVRRTNPKSVAARHEGTDRLGDRPGQRRERHTGRIDRAPRHALVKLGDIRLVGPCNEFFDGEGFRITRRNRMEFGVVGRKGERHFPSGHRRAQSETRRRIGEFPLDAELDVEVDAVGLRGANGRGRRRTTFRGVDADEGVAILREDLHTVVAVVTADLSVAVVPRVIAERDCLDLAAPILRSDPRENTCRRERGLHGLLCLEREIRARDDFVHGDEFTTSHDVTSFLGY